MKEDGHDISEGVLKGQLCPCMLSWGAGVKQMHAAMARVIEMLETRAALAKVLACMSSLNP